MRTRLRGALFAGIPLAQRALWLGHARRRRCRGAGGMRGLCACGGGASSPLWRERVVLLIGLLGPKGLVC